MMMMINSYLVYREENRSQKTEFRSQNKKKKCHCEEQSKPALAKAGEAISV